MYKYDDLIHDMRLYGEVINKIIVTGKQLEAREEIYKRIIRKRLPPCYTCVKGTGAYSCSSGDNEDCGNGYPGWELDVYRMKTVFVEEDKEKNHAR